MIAITEVDWEEVGTNIASGAGKIARHAGKYLKRAAEDVGDTVKAGKKFATRRLEDYQDEKKGPSLVKKFITKPISRSVEDTIDKGKLINKGVNRSLEDSGIVGRAVRHLKRAAGDAAGSAIDQTKYAAKFYKNKLNNNDDPVSHVINKAKELTGNAVNKAKDLTSDVVNKATKLSGDAIRKSTNT